MRTEAAFHSLLFHIKVTESPFLLGEGKCYYALTAQIMKTIPKEMVCTTKTFLFFAYYGMLHISYPILSVFCIIFSLNHNDALYFFMAFFMLLPYHFILFCCITQIFISISIYMTAFGYCNILCTKSYFLYFCFFPYYCYNLKNI